MNVGVVSCCCGWLLQPFIMFLNETAFCYFVLRSVLKNDLRKVLFFVCGPTNARGSVTRLGDF